MGVFYPKSALTLYQHFTLSMLQEAGVCLCVLPRIRWPGRQHSSCRYLSLDELVRLFVLCVIQRKVEFCCDNSKYNSYSGSGSVYGWGD